jgi:hypothetical protein
MTSTPHSDNSTKIVIGVYVIFSIWWVVLRFMNLPNDSDKNQLFAAVYGFIALFGGIIGINISRKWGGIHSFMGKSIMLFSLGLLFQEVGQLLYSYYIYFLHSPVPYPSIGDFFFYSTIPLYILGTLYLARTSGAHVSLRFLRSKLQVIVIPAIILLLSYVIFLNGYIFDWSKPIKVILDFMVPFGQAIYISLAILTYTLSKNVLGGLMKKRVLFILLGLVVQYIADWTFLYQASLNTWYAGGINDFMYLTAYFIMTFALLQMQTAYYKLNIK